MVRAGLLGEVRSEQKREGGEDVSPELPVGIPGGGKAGGWSRGQGEEGDEAPGGVDSPGSLGFSLPRPSCPALTPAP